MNLQLSKNKIIKKKKISPSKQKLRRKLTFAHFRVISKTSQIPNKIQ